MTSLSWRVTETLRYRFGNPDELPEIGRLVSHSFPGPSRSPQQWEEQLRDLIQHDGPETLVIAEDAGRIAASLLIHPFKVWIAGVQLPLAGVGMVTVSPTHRKRRVAGELMSHALRAARERGDVCSSLYPFRVSFYQKLGYGQADEALQYQISPDDLPDSPERMRVVLLDTDAGRAEALTFYNRWAQSQTGQFERSDHVWAKVLGAQDRALFGYRDAFGTLRGYAIVVYRADLPRRDRYLEVDEFVWASKDARRGLYGWLSSLGDQWDQLLMRALPSQRLGDWIREPRLPPGSAPSWRLWAPAATLVQGTMFRLLHLRDAWEQRRIAADRPFAIGLEVVDPQIAENQGTWRLAFEGERVTVDQRPSDATVRLNISTLSRLYIGVLSPQDAVNAGLLECDRPEILEPFGKALELPEPWTFDRF